MKEKVGLSLFKLRSVQYKDIKSGTVHDWTNDNEIQEERVQVLLDDIKSRLLKWDACFFQFNWSK